LKHRYIYLFLLVVIAASVSSAKALSDTDFQIRSLSNFDVYMYSSSLAFGLDSDEYKYVALEPLNFTAINGTNCELWTARMYGGKFSFTAQENAQVMIHENVGNVRWNGGSVGEGINADVIDGNQYTLEWSYTMAPLIPLTLILGLMGVGMGLGGPFYIVVKWRENHDFDGMIAGVVIMLIGFAFIIGWLWL